MQTATLEKTHCYHCGETCYTTIEENEKKFCCTGCKNVYYILQQNNLCNYYNLNNKPGINQKITIRKEKFDFLNDKNIANKFILFQNVNEVHINFYLPQIHCSSCLWLLENLHKLNASVISSRVHFTKKEIDIVFEKNNTSVKQIAELLTSIGYEPYISLQNMQGANKPVTNKQLIYQLAVAGFCFGNIMLLSFPEYLGLSETEPFFQVLFRYMSLILSLPVIVYSAQPFYKAAISNVQHKYLSVDAPVALAIILTFLRSIYDVFVLQNGGYFDSMTGIVFFMLIGRVLQNKTYQQLNFNRDYTAYFPISVDVLINDIETPTTLDKVIIGQTIVVYNESIIPIDGIVTKGSALIDYSFVTGESTPIIKEMGELVYAGGKQKNGRIEILVMKEVAQGYLTKLWNKETHTKPNNKSANNTELFINILNKYFSWIVLCMAVIACIYWAFVDSSKIIHVATTILIVACPCALILAGTFANGTIINILAANKLYIKNAEVIEKLASINHIVFDKTGTITSTSNHTITFYGCTLTSQQMQQIASVTAQSNHPLSKAITQHLQVHSLLPVTNFSEISGQGIEGFVQNCCIRIGSIAFVNPEFQVHSKNTQVHIALEEQVLGYFVIEHAIRKNLTASIKALLTYTPITILSGDNDAQKNKFQQIFGKKIKQYFSQSPVQKLQFVQQQQLLGYKVVMIGDGLNDAGALQASTVGIAVAENTNTFTPASDAIIDGHALYKLEAFIKLCKANKMIVAFSFLISIVYNIIGLSFALQGILSPLVAAILMPSSTISIILITYGISTSYSKKLGLL